MPKAPNKPAVALGNAVSSLRTVGTVFVLLGLLICYLAMYTRIGDPTEVIVVMLSDCIFLLGPGVLYHLTAILIRQQDVKIALIARRTAMIQSTCALTAAAAALLLNFQQPPRLWNPIFPMFVPAIFTVFFVPALLAQAFEIGRALAALALISESRRGFEVLAVLPVEEAPPPREATFDGSKPPTDDEADFRS